MHDTAPTDETREHVAEIRRRLRDYRLAQIYITFVELGIGDALSDGPVTHSDLAERCGCDDAALRRFLQAASATGLVQISDDDLVSATPLTTAAFTSTGDVPLVNLLRLEAAFYRRWAWLPDAVRSGQRPAMSREQEREPGWVRAFTRALYDASRGVAERAARAMTPLLNNPDAVTRIIDVGGGHGGYSLALARWSPNVTATVFDLPPVIEVTREIIEEAGLAGRVEARAGDFHVDPLGEGYDIALLFGVLHGERSEDIPALLGAIHDALRPGGSLLIRSQGSSALDPEPGERELTDLHMLLSTDAGSARNAIDTEQLLRDADFEIQPPIPIPDSGGGTLIVARRPGDRNV